MSGAVYYFAKVKQNKYPVPFELTSCFDKHADFENTEHDFPKKLEYRLVAKDALDVKVSDGATRSFTIHFKRNGTLNHDEEQSVAPGAAGLRGLARSMSFAAAR